MKSIYNFNHATINGNIIINSPENHDRFHTSEGDLNFKGAMEAIGNPDSEARLRERRRLGKERKTIRAAEAAERASKNVGINADMYLEDPDEVIGDIDLTDESDTENKVDGIPKRPNESRVTARILREKGKVLASTEDGSIILYSSGYALYQNLCGKKTVLWAPDCRKHDFTRLKAKPEYDLGRADMDTQVWYLAIMICGEYQIESNSYSGQIDKKRARFDNATAEDEENCRDYRDNSNRDEVDEADDGKSYGPYRFENPEKAYLKKAAFETFMSQLSSMQRNIVIAYHIYGFTFSQIGEGFGVDDSTVRYHYNNAALAIGEYAMKFLEIATDLYKYCDEYCDKKMIDRMIENQDLSNPKYRRSNCRAKARRTAVK